MQYKEKQPRKTTKNLNIETNKKSMKKAVLIQVGAMNTKMTITNLDEQKKLD